MFTKTVFMLLAFFFSEIESLNSPIKLRFPTSVFYVVEFIAG